MANNGAGIRFKLTKDANGSHHLSYECPTCATLLDSDIEEAGQAIACPACRQRLTVPGRAERIRLESERKAAAIAEQKAAELAKVKAKEDAARAAAAKKAAADRAAQERAAPPKECANCSRVIGKLEKHHVHDGHIVCQECKARLQPAVVEYASPAAAVPVVYQQPAPVRQGCPICHSQQPPVKQSKGSCLLAGVLLLLWVLPGILYLIFCNGYVYKCPQCGYKYGDA